MKISQTQKDGFTLVELLVVIAIISLLIGLLMPAVQAARESGRRTSCMNNLRQLNLASHQYHDVHKHLEPGWTGTGEIADPGWGWASFLLPYLEQESLHESIRFDVAVHEAVNLKAAGTYIPSMACPSDYSSGGKRFTMPEYIPENGTNVENFNLPVQVAASNYIVFFSSELYEHIERDEYGCPGEYVTFSDVEKGIGAFYLNSETRFESIRDGLSNTIFYGEKTSGIKRHNDKIVDDDFYPTWTGVFRGAKLPLWRIAAWGQDTMHYLGKHHDYSVYSSHHSQVSVFAFGDGAVAPVADLIDIDVFKALNTINGKEVIGADSF